MQVSVLGVAVWSGRRRNRRRSKIWTHWFQRLDDRCPGLFRTWLTRDMSVWPRNADASLSSIVARGQGCCCESSSSLLQRKVPVLAARGVGVCCLMIQMSTARRSWVQRWLLAASRATDLGTYVSSPAGYWKMHRFRSFGQRRSPRTYLVTDCCVYIKVTGCLFFGLNEENSMLSRTGNSSFKYKN